MLVLLFQREAMSFAGMFGYHNYNTLACGNTTYWLIFNLQDIQNTPKDEFVV